jgi:hypothetical protein
MPLDDTVLKRLTELIDAGDRVLATRRPPPPNSIGFDASVDSAQAYQWFTSAQSILARVFGTDSEHYKNFSAQGEKHVSFSPAVRAQGVLKAAKDDFEHGYLFDLKKLIEADVFVDLLDQAEALLGAGYYQACAVIAGAVLEDALRRLVSSAGVPVPTKPKLDSMNTELAKAGVYNKLTQKRITAIADVRNSAAHGQWDQFEERDVKEAVEWIRNFMESQFS